MQRESFLLVVAAVFSVVLMFLPSLGFAMVCMLDGCSYKDLQTAQSFQWFQVAWLLAFLHFGATRLGGYARVRAL